MQYSSHFATILQFILMLKGLSRWGEMYLFWLNFIKLDYKSISNGHIKEIVHKQH